MDLPARILKYELEEYLGGGMSRVYRARDTLIGRTVAVKILAAEYCEDPDARSRFLQEARLAGNVVHENIVRIFDFGEDEQKRPFLVMEFLCGENLKEAMQNSRTGDLRHRLGIALQVAHALAHIHNQKIVHRDIKPENIFLTNSGVAKLIDFGIAKEEGLSMTQTGFVLGTPFYMAPEQVRGQAVTERVDIYAFGVLLYELLTGVRPVTGEKIEQIFYQILNEPLDPAPLRVAGVPEAVCEIVRHATAKDPAARPATFETICNELARVLAQAEPKTDTSKGVEPTQTLEIPRATPHARRRGLIPVVAAICVVAAVVPAYFFLHRSGAMRTAIIQEKILPGAITTPVGEMVLVPAGQFQFGAQRQPLSLPSFYIDKTEVTNRAYATFCRVSGHALPPDFPANLPEYPGSQHYDHRRQAVRALGRQAVADFGGVGEGVSRRRRPAVSLGRSSRTGARERWG